MLWIVGIQVEAVVTKCREVDVSAGRMELKMRSKSGKPKAWFESLCCHQME